MESAAGELLQEGKVLRESSCGEGGAAGKERAAEGGGCGKRKCCRKGGPAGREEGLQEGKVLR